PLDRVPSLGILVLAWMGAQTVTVAGLAMALLLLGLVGWGVRRRPALWAAALLLVPGMPLVLLLGEGLFGSSAWTVMPTGLVAGVAVLASAIKVARRDPLTGEAPSPRRSAEEALGISGALALWLAATVALFAWLPAGPYAEQTLRP